MIIDFRVRPPYKSFLSCAVFDDCKPAPEHPWQEPGLCIERGFIPSVEERSWEMFLQEMEQAGIDMAVVMGRQTSNIMGFVSNDDIDQICREYPNKFIPVAGIDGSDPVKAVYEIERTIKGMGFKGISIEPGYCTPPLYPDDALLDPIYKKCQELGVFVSITASLMVGPDMTYTDPMRIHRVARRYPELKIAIPHACWPYVDAVLGMALHCRNVYLVPDFYGTLPLPMSHEFITAANHYLKYRMVYASSYPVRDLIQSLELYKKLPFNPETLKMSLYDNAARLLGL